MFVKVLITVLGETGFEWVRNGARAEVLVGFLNCPNLFNAPCFALKGNFRALGRWGGGSKKYSHIFKFSRDFKFQFRIWARAAGGLM